MKDLEIPRDRFWSLSYIKGNILHAETMLK